MKKEYSLHTNVLEFAINTKSLVDELNNKKEFLLSNQLFRAASSIGANVFEAKYAESKNDLIHKYKIALKEANECVFWFKLIQGINILEESEIYPLYQKCTILIKILTKCINNLKN